MPMAANRYGRTLNTMMRLIRAAPSTIPYRTAGSCCLNVALSSSRDLPISTRSSSSSARPGVTGPLCRDHWRKELEPTPRRCIETLVGQGAVFFVTPKSAHLDRLNMPARELHRAIERLETCQVTAADSDRDIDLPWDVRPLQRPDRRRRRSLHSPERAGTPDIEASGLHTG